MNISQQCPFCSSPIINQVKNGKILGYCRHCHQYIPPSLIVEKIASLPSDRPEPQSISQEQLKQELFHQELKRLWQWCGTHREPLGLLFCQWAGASQTFQQIPPTRDVSSLVMFSQAIAQMVRRNGDRVLPYDETIVAVILPSTNLWGVNRVAENIQQHLKPMAKAINDLYVGGGNITPHLSASSAVLVDLCLGALQEARNKENLCLLEFGN